jgi:hypothetical protein
MMAEFNFIEAYKQLQPTADRVLVDARDQGARKILETLTLPQVIDLARLAFQLPYEPTSYVDWFQAPLHEPDPHFFVAQDPAEAGRIATLALRQRVFDRNTAIALVVLAASYAGTRAAFDNGELVTQSRDLVTASAKKGGMTAPSGKIGLPKAGDISKQKTEMTNGFDAAHTAPFVEAAVQDLRNGSESAIAALSEAYQALRNDNLRLGEETDMLWWHVGDWSNILDVPRASIAKKSVGLVSGLDLGAMVRFSPGPYGAYGILKQSLGTNGDKPISMIDAVAGLEESQIARLVLQKAPDVFPVLTALRLAAAGGDWKIPFGKVVPDAASAKLTHLELATQAFRERVSMTNIGLA